MRYEIGNTYLFIHVSFTNEKHRFGSLYLPWEDKLEKINLLKLTCTEHHKVPIEFYEDSDRSADGFIFEEASVYDMSDFEEGRKWANQYPRACYGQLDDSNDRMVRRILTNEEETSIKQMTKEKLDWFLTPYNDVLSYISTIKKAVDGNEKHKVKFEKEEHEISLRHHLDEVEEMIVRFTNKEVSYKDLEFKTNDGKVSILKGYPIAELV